MVEGCDRTSWFRQIERPIAIGRVHEILAIIDLKLLKLLQVPTSADEGGKHCSKARLD
jgi:hypothetical protein